MVKEVTVLTLILQNSTKSIPRQIEIGPRNELIFCLCVRSDMGQI